MTRNNRKPLSEVRVPDLAVDIAGLRLRSPILTASGTFGYGKEYWELVDYECLGAVVVKGISLAPHPGNPPPRTAETPCGLLNAIGLQNPGVDFFLSNHLPFLLECKIPVIVNIWGKTESEYAEVASRLDRSGVHALELNVSCPNIKSGGIQFGLESQSLQDIIRSTAAASRLPLIVKLPPSLHHIAELAQAAEDAGAAAVTVANTVPAMKIDVERRRPALGAITGGLSGPAIHPIAVRLVWIAARAVKIPVIASGGAATTDDVLEFLIAGAGAVQIGTAVFSDPGIFARVRDGVVDYLRRNGFASVQDLIGCLELESPEGD